METLTNTINPSDPPAASPRWILLEPYVNQEDSDPSVADAKTTAASCTSSGQSFSVSFALAAPPASSRYYCNWIGGDGSDSDEDNPRHDGSKNLRIIAAHDDSVLIQMSVPGGSRYTYDYFLYEAGAARLPLLSLLPGCYDSSQLDRPRRRRAPRIRRTRSLHKANTAMLRHGVGELLVAQLKVIRPQDMAELCVLRPGSEYWEILWLPIAHHKGGCELPQCLNIDAAVPIGVQFVCWVDYNSGFVLCDMADEITSPKLLYIPLPEALPEEPRRNRDRPYLPYCRNLGASGHDTVRLVIVAPRCCCGGNGKISCEPSRFAFNVTTWTMTLKMEEPMTWVKDGVLDCHELWQLPNYGCLPRVAPQYPIVSSENPDVVCFVLCENYYFITDHYLKDHANEMVWLLEIDTRSKALLSVVRCDTTGSFSEFRLPAKLRW